MNISFKELLHKYNTGSCTPEEKAIIESWYQQLELPDLAALSDEQLDEIISLTPEIPVPARQKRLSSWLPVAAAITLLIITGAYFMLRPGKPVIKQPVAAAIVNDALPGSNKAILTLANGKQIALTDAENGQLAKQGNIIISKKSDGELNYEGEPYNNAEQPAAGEPMINTVSTPRGGQHHLVLTDGTNVWLNAASSIKYPVAFNDKERIVEITGEAYFEVSPNNNRPFRVICQGQAIAVLGTDFNVNAYADEAVVKTTLLSGAVRVTADAGKSVLLRPGQQSVLNTNHDIKISAADTEAATDWKEGDFIFKNETLPDIMRKVSRWYDVDVNYDNYSKSNQTFSGVVSRSRNLSAVVKMLERTATVKFIIKNNQIIITDKDK